MIPVSTIKQRMVQMTRRRPAKLALILLVLCGTVLLLLFVPQVNAKHPRSNSTRKPSAAQPDSVINGHAVFHTNTKQTPEGQDDVDDGGVLSLTLIEREYHGDLEGKSKGHSLGLATNVEGSVTIITMERITGTLQGRKGSFVITRNVVTTHSVPEMSIVVANDSGSGQLAGIAGKIVRRETPHNSESKTPQAYDFYYTLPATSQKP